MVLVLVSAVLLLAGCSGSPDATPGGPTSSPTKEQLREPTTHVMKDGVGRPATVGVLVGSRLTEVRIALQEQGLRLDVRRRARCAPGVVLAQRPAPGTKLERGSTVRLVVAQAPDAAACIVPPGAAAGRALRAWALGEQQPPPFAERVRLLVANRVVRTLTAAQAADRDQWILDVAYAERVDVRILETLAVAPMRAARVPPFFCLGRGRAVPDDLLRRLSWSSTLVTSEAETLACMDVAAVQVWAAGDGRITDVNLLMGSP